MKTRKTIAAVLTVLLLALIFSGCAKKTDGLSYKSTEGGLKITGYTDKTTVTEIAIPDEIDGLPVVEIADFGVCNAESLTKITIGKNVKTLGSWALTNNQHLQEFVVDPENPYLTAVDGVLFSKDFKTLYYYPCGKGVQFDKYGRAENAVTYEIPEGVEVIASKAFYKCGHTDITSFPSSLKRIEEKAFFKCYYYEKFTEEHVVESGLSDFTLPEGVEYIGKDAFAYDELLTDLTLPASVREIGEFAFFNCKNMKTLRVLANENELTLGNKWQPTAKGKVIEECDVTFGG